MWTIFDINGQEAQILSSSHSHAPPVLASPEPISQVKPRTSILHQRKAPNVAVGTAHCKCPLPLLRNPPPHPSRMPQRSSLQKMESYSLGVHNRQPGLRAPAMTAAGEPAFGGLASYMRMTALVLSRIVEVILPAAHPLLHSARSIFSPASMSMSALAFWACFLDTASFLSHLQHAPPGEFLQIFSFNVDGIIMICCLPPSTLSVSGFQPQFLTGYYLPHSSNLFCIYKHKPV